MNDDDDDDNVLLKKKVKTEVEKVREEQRDDGRTYLSSFVFQEKEEKEFIEWLKGQKSDISDSTMKSDLVRW